jgi:hypothetical protein
MPKRKEIKKILIIASGPIVVALLLYAMPKANAASQQMDRVNTLDRLCGRLFYVESPDTRHAKSTSLPKVDVGLYRKDGDASCCVGSTPVAEALTGRSGKFEFKKVPAGVYWIVVNSHGREYKMVIRYEPVKENPTACSELLYQVDDAGHFNLKALVTLD